MGIRHQRRIAEKKGSRIPSGIFLLVLWAMGLLAIGCYGLVPPTPALPSGTKTPTPAGAIPQGLPTGGKFKAVCVADLDNDGFIDIAGGMSTSGAVAHLVREGAREI